MSKYPIQNYSVQKVIGKGAFAVVYQAQNNKTKEIVAIKQINIDMEEGPHKKKMLELFQQEINIMKSIKHKNILELKEVQWNFDAINMILEYCALGDLEKYIKKNSLKNRLQESDAKPIILQLIDALKMLRLKNVVHRDLKLANILINEQMQIKLADFGFAKLLGDDLLESYCGTPITMAPEILKKNDTYDYKCDVWSLGVMIYQILFGSPPFVPQKGTVQDLIIAIQTQKLQFPQHISVTAECKDLLRKMIVEDPKQRASFEEIFQHPWCFNDNIDLEKSILQSQAPQHEEFLKGLSLTINLSTNTLQKITKQVDQLQKKYPDMEAPCVRFKNSLNSAFSTLLLKVKYSNKFVLLRFPENQETKIFDLQQEFLCFLCDIYEIGIQNKINIQEFKALECNFVITNILDITYDNYSITLKEEIQNMNQLKNGGALLQLNPPQIPNRFLSTDLQILGQLIQERY